MDNVVAVTSIRAFQMRVCPFTQAEFVRMEFCEVQRRWLPRF
ncbi:hypothetical protein RRSWK_05879 [Rhodopirellula sp. SWK7]|nr:hypothetical protein RRSWK_05879 [Rhodopirellula sp. SWK7]